MVVITKHSEGSILAVRAQPGAKRNAVLGEQAGALKVAVSDHLRTAKQMLPSLKCFETGWV